MIERDRHRSDAAPAVAGDVVALDRRGRRPGAFLEAADDEHEPTDARGGDLSAAEQGIPQRRPRTGAGATGGGVAPGRLVVAVGDDCGTGGAAGDHDHGGRERYAAHDPPARRSVRRGE
jgi:hypothetical protein